jgi:hypothetical protein
MTRVTGTFKTLGWDERPYDNAGGQPRLTHAEVTHELLGGIAGEASVSYLLGYREDNTATFVGLVRVTGAIGERSGSFVMQDIGTFENGVAKGRWTILPGLGTDGLRDIRGEGHFAASHESASYSLDIEYGRQPELLFCHPELLFCHPERSEGSAVVSGVT